LLIIRRDELPWLVKRLVGCGIGLDYEADHLSASADVI
jgi:hypothetical protein